MEIAPIRFDGIAFSFPEGQQKGCNSLGELGSHRLLASHKEIVDQAWQGVGWGVKLTLW